MSIKAGFFFWVRSSVLASAFLACIERARADHLVIMKDGFTLSGTIKREMTNVVEPGVYMQIPKLNGFYWVDDGARRMIFGHKQVQEALQTDVKLDADLRFDSPFTRMDHWRLPAGLYGLVTAFDSGWNRIFTIEGTQRGRVVVDQHLSVMTPHYVRVDANQYNWSPHYLT